MSVLSINIVIPTAFHKHCCAGRPLRGKSALSVSRRIRPRTKTAQSGNTFPSGTKRRAPRRQRRPRIFGRGRPCRGVCRDAQSDVRSPARPRRRSHSAAKASESGVAPAVLLRGGFCFVQSIRRSHAASPAQPSGVRSGIAPPIHLQFGVCFARPSGGPKAQRPRSRPASEYGDTPQASLRARRLSNAKKESVVATRARHTLFAFFAYFA